MVILISIPRRKTASGWLLCTHSKADVWCSKALVFSWRSTFLTTKAPDDSATSGVIRIDSVQNNGKWITRINVLSNWSNYYYCYSEWQQRSQSIKSSIYSVNYSKENYHNKQFSKLNVLPIQPNGTPTFNCLNFLPDRLIGFRSNGMVESPEVQVPDVRPCPGSRRAIESYGCRPSPSGWLRCRSSGQVCVGGSYKKPWRPFRTHFDSVNTKTLT